LELGGALAGDRCADEARRVEEEERHLLGGHVLGRHDEVALVLAVLVVHHDQDLASRERLERLVDVGERREVRVAGRGKRLLAHVLCPSRSDSTYFAMTSSSMLTGSPVPLCPSVVTSAVWGMTATEKPSSWTAAPVRLGPAQGTA